MKNWKSDFNFWYFRLPLHVSNWFRILNMWGTLPYLQISGQCGPTLDIYKNVFKNDTLMKCRFQFTNTKKATFWTLERHLPKCELGTHFFPQPWMNLNQDKLTDFAMANWQFSLNKKKVCERALVTKLVIQFTFSGP